MKKNLILTVAFLMAICLLCMPQIGFAISAITASPGTIDVYKINEMTPGSREVRLGTRLQGILQKEVEAVTTSGDKDLSTGMMLATFVTPIGSTNLGTGDRSFANGYQGQLQNFLLVTDGAGDVDITPLTKTGFTSFTLDDAGDAVTLRYVNDTIGWIVDGNSAATINQ